MIIWKTMTIITVKSGHVFTLLKNMNMHANCTANPLSKMDIKLMSYRYDTEMNLHRKKSR